MFENQNPVPGTGEGVPAEGMANSAPEQGGVSQQPQQQETPATQKPVDVDIEALKKKYEQDISNLRSSLDRKRAELDREWRERYETMRRQLHEARMQSMTDDERAKYERQLEIEEMNELRSRLAELEQEREQQAATWNAYNFFVSEVGVPAERLNLSEGAVGVTTAGWAWIKEELARLRAIEQQFKQQPQTAPQSSEPTPPKQAPAVVNDKGTPASGTTWKALIERYGSRENVYRAVEEGRLPPSIIPLGE